MDVNWPSINAVIIPASASIFLGDSCITNVHTRSTNACYAGAIPSCQPIDIIPFAYSNFLVVTAYSRPFAESLAALLPCYWIYWEVGKQLKTKGSKDSLYQRWIDAYSSEEYGDSVKAILEIVNQSSASASPSEILRMKEHFRHSARYEWMFWESAYQRQAWPPEEQ